jgi:hypothetical protein
MWALINNRGNFITESFHHKRILPYKIVRLFPTKSCAEFAAGRAVEKVNKHLAFTYPRSVKVSLVIASQKVRKLAKQKTTTVCCKG